MNKRKIRKLLFYPSFVLAIIFTFRMFKIIMYDLMNLTSYGWGYLVGNIALALLFSLGAYITSGRNTIRP